jgi:large subunit ribosomal protein L21
LKNEKNSTLSLKNLLKLLLFMNFYKKTFKIWAENLTFAVQKNFHMLAVVKIAGQQFKVKAGDKLYVPRIEGNTGDKVAFSDVLMTDNNGIVTFSNISAIVNAEITNALVQGDKVIAFKMKRRKGFRKKKGHRTHYTQLKIESIA